MEGFKKWPSCHFCQDGLFCKSERVKWQDMRSVCKAHDALPRSWSCAKRCHSWRSWTQRIVSWKWRYDYTVIQIRFLQIPHLHSPRQAALIPLQISMLSKGWWKKIQCTTEKIFHFKAVFDVFLLNMTYWWNAPSKYELHVLRHFTIGIQ